MVHQGCLGHLLALSKNLGSSVAGNVPPSLRKSPRRGGARWVVAAPGRAVSSEASGRRGKRSASAHALAVCSRGEQARHAVSRSPAVGSRCPAAGRPGEQAGGPSLPARRSPPRPPASCGGSGRHVVVGVRRRRRSPAAVTGCATGSLRPT